MSLFYSHPWLIIWISCRSISLCFLKESFHCLFYSSIAIEISNTFLVPIPLYLTYIPSRIFPLSLAVWKFTMVCLRMLLFSLIVLDTQGFFWLYLYFFPFLISLLISSLPIFSVLPLWITVSRILGLQFVVIHSLSRVWLFATPWTAAHQASLSFTNSWNLLKLRFIELVMPSNHLIFCHPLLLQHSIFPSIRVFPNESALHIR